MKRLLAPGLPGAGPLTGLDSVDRTLRDLSADLQRLSQGWTPERQGLSAVRWAAIELVGVAIRAHQAAAGPVETVETWQRDFLPGLTGKLLVQVWEDVSRKILQALQFLPESGFQRLRAMDPGPCVEEGEWFHLGYQAEAAPFAKAAHAVRRFAWLRDARMALSAEHERRFDDRMLPGLFVDALAAGRGGEVGTEIALKELERLLPISKVRRGKFGGEPEGKRTPPNRRQEDLVQDLREALMELVARKRGTPVGDVLRGLYDGDPDLLFLPHAATQDFMNRRKAAREREALASFEPLSEDLSERTLSEAELAQRILGVFRHSAIEEKILRLELQAGLRLDASWGPSRGEIARKAGCHPVTVSKYRQKRLEHKAAILKALLA
jgi:hypothetical protein